MLFIAKGPKFREKYLSRIKKKNILNVWEWVHFVSPRSKMQRQTWKRVPPNKPCNGKHKSISPRTMNFSWMNK